MIPLFLAFLLSAAPGSAAAPGSRAEQAARAWATYVAAQRTWQTELARLLTRDRPDFTDVGELNRDLQLALIERRSLIFDYLLRTAPQRIVMDRGVSAFANFDWNEQDDAALRTRDAKFRAVEERLEKLRKANDGNPKWPAFREHARKAAVTPEYQAILAQFQSALKGVERALGAP